MRKIRALLYGLVALGLTAAMAVPAAATPLFSTTSTSPLSILAQRQQNPPQGQTGIRAIPVDGRQECTDAGNCGSVGDQDGRATVDLTFSADESQVCWRIFDVTNVALPSTGWHVHRAPVGRNGPIVLPLGTVSRSGDTGCATGVAVNLVRDMRANPGNYYVNLHNRQFPNGAIRGQLSGGTPFPQGTVEDCLLKLGDLLHLLCTQRPVP